MGANLIDRLNNPEQFLKDIAQHIVPGGFLVLFSPYTWLSDYTPKDNWIGGRQKDGENLYTRDGLENILSENFDPVKLRIDGDGYSDPIYGFLETGTGIKQLSIPFAIQETRRKH